MHCNQQTLNLKQLNSPRRSVATNSIATPPIASPILYLLPIPLIAAKEYACQGEEADTSRVERCRVLDKREAVKWKFRPIKGIPLLLLGGQAI